jgi:hypothetical protein
MEKALLQLFLCKDSLINPNHAAQQFSPEKGAPGLGRIITPWRGEWSSAVWLRRLRPPRGDFLLRLFFID